MIINKPQKAVLVQDFFKNKRDLGPSIRVGGAKREFFSAWHFLGPPIDSCR